ncbi:MAG TPA: AAA family ATPase, partial [Gaiellaceae bacterium]|nr:AAA family ATPase [Gaiellaceae bacterium]
FRATERVFEWEPLEPVLAKGKAELLTIFRPLRSRARFGSDVTRTHSTPLVGRELEKPLLIGVYERAAAQRSCQLVTMVGEPGVGKSRMCMELFQHIEERPGLVRWRQGRCLPYGEGIAFWALGEIVKAEAGILESDSPEVAAQKLERALPQDDPDVTWLRARLQPLVGAGGQPASQEEAFTAWRRVLESWAAERETVLVFEDLHWADDALLSFLEHLADWSEGVPLLVLCTARPELLEQRPAWAAGLRNATMINLPPLTDEETGTLVSSLLQQTLLPAETRAVLLERAGGNPLYAEEFVRLLADQSADDDQMQVPDSVQALIAARLDTLSPDRKGLLQDASVVGKVFWAGALVEMGGRDPREVEQALHELSRKELVRPARTSSMEGDAEYGFWHGLVADVCYSQIPRAARATAHRAAAAWIERKGGERVDDLADVLAHHYLTALELARASGQDADISELKAAAIRYLALAGERSLPLDVGRAEQSLALALELAGRDGPESAPLLERWGIAAQQQNRLQEAKEALEDSLALYRERDERIPTGRVLTHLSLVLGRLGDPAWRRTIDEAIELLEAEPPGQELVDAYVRLASSMSVHAVYREAIERSGRAADLAAELGLPTPPGALGTRGNARAALGDPQGVDDLRQALELSIEQGQGRMAAISYANLAFVTWLYEGPKAAIVVGRAGTEFSQRHGDTDMALHLTGGMAPVLAEIGDTEAALEHARAAAERQQASGSIFVVESRTLELRLLAEQGRHEQVAVPDELVGVARESGEPQVIANAFSTAAQLLLAQSRSEEAQALLAELCTVDEIRGDPVYAGLLAGLVRTALALPDAALAQQLLDGVQPVMPLAAHALAAGRAQLAEAAGDLTEASHLYAEAAERWREFGNVPELAYALLGYGRSLSALGDPSAEPPLSEARDLFASMGYGPALANTEGFLAASRASA